MSRHTCHALEFFKHADRVDVPAVCAVWGNEGLLKHQVLNALKKRVGGGGDAELGLSTLSGKTAKPAEVFDELATVALFGSARRCVIVDDADDFVKRHRLALEEYVSRPSEHGALILNLTTWPKTTRLYKHLDQTGLQVECTTPQPAKIKTWLAERAAAYHGAVLQAGADEALLELLDPDLGLLDQELAKLALLAGKDGTITRGMVHKSVGTWRHRTAWELIDAAASGNAAEALAQLDRLLLAGEHPIAVLAQMGATLRRFAHAARRIEQSGRPVSHAVLTRALKESGVPHFATRKAGHQLKQLGRQRAEKLLSWLLTADLALKGSSSAPDRGRLVLETLIVRMARVADPRRG